ncbi:DUF1707 domain-containing protein [Streptomyces albidoflavus]
MSEELPELRASDADREKVAERLRDAMAEGRLDMDEFGERLDAVYRARTYAELEPLTRDLPATGTGAPAARAGAEPGGENWPARIGGTGDARWGIGVLSGFQHTGRWTVPARFKAIAFWGGGQLDLREARFESRETVIDCWTVMGGVNIVVPPGVQVEVRGIGIMGGFGRPAGDDTPDPDAPRVVVRGFAFWGGVGTERKPTRAQRRLEKERRRDEGEGRKELG